jgi:hypothetical protein
MTRRFFQLSSLTVPFSALPAAVGVLGTRGGLPPPAAWEACAERSSVRTAAPPEHATTSHGVQLPFSASQPCEASEVSSARALAPPLRLAPGSQPRPFAPMAFTRLWRLAPRWAWQRPLPRSLQRSWGSPVVWVLDLSVRPPHGARGRDRGPRRRRASTATSGLKPIGNHRGALSLSSRVQRNGSAASLHLRGRSDQPASGLPRFTQRIAPLQGLSWRTAALRLLPRACAARTA